MHQMWPKVDSRIPQTVFFFFKYKKKETLERQEGTGKFVSCHSIRRLHRDPPQMHLRVLSHSVTNRRPGIFILIGHKQQIRIFKAKMLFFQVKKIVKSIQKCTYLINIHLSAN